MSNSTDLPRARLISPLVWKAITIGAVLLLLLVAVAQVRGLLNERADAREHAAQRVRDSIGGAQVTGAVVLSVPIVTTRVIKDRIDETRSVVYVLPDTLEIGVTMQPEVRRSGLYEIPTFAATIGITGSISARDLERLRAVVPGRAVRFEEARLLVLSNEPRTLRAFDRFTIGETAVAREAGGYAGYAGASGAVPVELLRGSGDIAFAVSYQLVGTEYLSVLPLGRTARVKMQSSWPHPSFTGVQSPIRQKVGPQGFEAEWTTLEISRGFGQSWQDDTVHSGLSASDAIGKVSVGVRQYQPVDIYQRNHRALHYAMLVIAITFMTFFLVEQILRKPLHGMQYLFVGLALAVFYLLLLALSEHVTFLWAYVSAATALVLLVALYLQGALRSAALAWTAGAGLALIYALMYLIMVSEDYSLLMGALLLFGVLAILMLTTRRFDWSTVGRQGERVGG